LDAGDAVERDANVRAAELDAQRVPLAAGDRRLDVLDGVALAVGGVIQGHVVLERVGARDVVVVAVLPAPHHAARLVLAPGHGLHLHLDETVGDGRAVDAPRKLPAAGLLPHVGRARRGGVALHAPARRAFAGDTRLPAVGQ